MGATAPQRVVSLLHVHAARHHAVQGMAYGYVLALAAWKKDRVSLLDWGGGLGHYNLISQALLPLVEINIADIPERVTVDVVDVRDEQRMGQLIRRQDYLFNLAGQTSHIDSMRFPQVDMEMNCRAQLSVLEACRQHNPEVRIVFASTRQLYGRPDYLPVDEKHPVLPVDINGVNKMAGESYHLLYHVCTACARAPCGSRTPSGRACESRTLVRPSWGSGSAVSFRGHPSTCGTANSGATSLTWATRSRRSCWRGRAIRRSAVSSTLAAMPQSVCGA